MENKTFMASDAIENRKKFYLNYNSTRLNIILERIEEYSKKGRDSIEIDDIRLDMNEFDALRVRGFLVDSTAGMIFIKWI